ncbi:MAG: hypothetical protein ACI4I5_01100 [Acutalibacteraceae bacterium]
MKKIVSVLLVLSMLVALLIPVSAEAETSATQVSAIARIEDTLEPSCEYPIIFVTGIGQTWTHLVKKDGSYKKDIKGEPIEYNLFYVDIKGLFQPKAFFATLRFLGEFVGSMILDRNLVRAEDVEALFTGLLHYNIVDENGKLPADVEDTVKPYPLSEYNELDTKNFFRSIPCQDIVPEVGAENIFCFNHPAFSFLYDDADGLHEFIGTVLEKYTDADKVVLVPMSMGAAVTNAYLDRYGDCNEVARVVSIVGAWDGSDVVADLVEKKYASNAPELLYNGIVADLIGEPFGYIVNILLRAFPKATLRDIIDTALTGVVRPLILKTPSMMALVPSSRYEAIEKEYLSGDEWAYIRAQTRPYYEAQKNLQTRLRALEAQGMEFYFISGYGLKFGGYSDDYAFFQFMESAETTNADEIIQISSTAPGATFAPFDQSLDVKTPYTSPDGSVDLSTCFAPDRTWIFHGQKHELEYNNTAIRLAFEIAMGTVTSVAQVADVYPQFNESRDAKRLIRGEDNYIIQLTEYIEENEDDPAMAENVAKAQKTLDACMAMMNETHNDREADDAVMDAAFEVLVELGIREAPKTKKTSLGTKLLRKLNDKVYDIFGAEGFVDALPWK